MGEEIKETIFVAIGLFLAAAVLSLIMFTIHMQKDLANVQNDKVVAEFNNKYYYEFNKYSDSYVYGEDIIGAIREYAGTKVQIYVDYLACADTIGNTRKTYLQVSGSNADNCFFSR